MEEIISKEIARKLMAAKGLVRGVAIKNEAEFILKNKGQDGFEALEKAMAELGCPVKYDQVQSWEFYPIGFETIELLLIKKLFGFGDDKIEEIGAFGSKASVVMKVFFKYFTSMRTVAQQAPAIWRKYYTIGDLNVQGLNEKEKVAVLVLENFKVHPIHCLDLKGYFASVVKMVVGGKVSCEETKCQFSGNNCHEFLMRW